MLRSAGCLSLDVWDRDHRRLGHPGMPHGEVFYLYGADPLAPGLDHVLGAVGQLDVTQAVDRTHVWESE